MEATTKANEAAKAKADGAETKADGAETKADGAETKPAPGRDADGKPFPPGPMRGLHRADTVMDRPYDELIEGEWFASRQRTITEADVVQFAALTGDWHPAHTNKIWAEKNIFGERVAHGMLLLSYAIGLVPNAYVVALRRIKNVTYKTPVRFGDTIHVRGMVLRMQPFSDEVGMVTARWKLLNQREETCLKMEFETLWKRGWIQE